jgi:hypothetical protein
MGVTAVDCPQLVFGPLKVTLFHTFVQSAWKMKTTRSAMGNVLWMEALKF